VARLLAESQRLVLELGGVMALDWSGPRLAGAARAQNRARMKQVTGALCRHENEVSH